jgi:predicted NBD/HSP70 family sugar kinase
MKKTNTPLATEPACKVPLDPGFRPASLATRVHQTVVEDAGGGEPLVIALQRPDGSVSRFETAVLPEGHGQIDKSIQHAERVFKFLLWQRGGCTAFVGGPRSIGDYIASVYTSGGLREFDAYFMGNDVYDREFTVQPCDVSEVPGEVERSRPLGRHLDGCRIGFDLGASDRKVAAVVDGSVVYSEEVVWEPRMATDCDYHYQEIMTALNRAAREMPRVDAVGGSSAGIVVDNQVRVASLFRAVPPEKRGEMREIFTKIQRELRVPLEVVNDGEVTALAASMTLGVNGVLGVALGSSQAAGYVKADGNITSWLNELAFAPVDYGPSAAVDEWSGDRGCGAQYFSQQCVFRLAPLAGIDLPEATPAAQLEAVQEKLESGHSGARQIWESIAVYLGYAIAHYATFYDLKHVLILGRCTSGIGGRIIIDGAHRVLKAEFPELVDRIQLHLPDESSRRVGQSIAAASLPMIVKNGQSL